MFNMTHLGIGALDPSIALSSRELDQKNISAEETPDYYKDKGVPLSPDIAYLIQLNRMLESRANQPQSNAAPSTVMQDLQRMTQGAPQQQMQPNQQQMPQGAPQQQQQQPQQQMDPRLSSGIGQLPVNNVGTKHMASGGIVAFGGGGPMPDISTLYPGVSVEDLKAEIKSLKNAKESSFKINRAEQALQMRLDEIAAKNSPIKAVPIEAGANEAVIGNPLNPAQPQTLSSVPPQNEGLGSFRDVSAQNPSSVRPTPTSTGSVGSADNTGPVRPTPEPASTLSDIDAENLARQRAKDRAAMEADRLKQEARWADKGTAAAEGAAAEGAAAESGIMGGIRRSMPTLSRLGPKIIKGLGGLAEVAAPLAAAGNAIGAAGSDPQSIQETSRLAQLGMNVDPTNKLKTGAATFAGILEGALPSSLFYNAPLNKAQKSTDKKISSIDADGAKLVQRSPDDMAFAKQYQELRKTDPEAAEQLMQTYRDKLTTAQEGIGGEAEKIAAARKATRQQAGKPAYVPTGGVIPAEASNAAAAKVAGQAAPAAAEASPFIEMMKMIQANQDKYAERASSGVYNKAQDAYSKERQDELEQRSAAADKNSFRDRMNALSRAGFGAVGTGRNFVQTAANIGKDYTNSVQTMNEAKKALDNSISDAKAKLRESDALRADGQVEKADALQREAQQNMMALAGRAAEYSQKERELAQTGAYQQGVLANQRGEQGVQQSIAGERNATEVSIANLRNLHEQTMNDKSIKGSQINAVSKQLLDLRAQMSLLSEKSPYRVELQKQYDMYSTQLAQLTTPSKTGQGAPALTMSPNGQLTGQ
jgi:hypothetical protein